jgi:sRNA-binding protein
MREESEAGIAKLAELYPACFFVEAYQRRPLVKTILSDLEKDGAPLSYEQAKAAVDWYQSSWGYLRNVKAGVKRLNLLGEERATVTAAEERHCAARLADEKKRVKEEKEDRSRSEVRAESTAMPKKPLTPIPPPSLRHLRQRLRQREIRSDTCCTSSRKLAARARPFPRRGASQ